MRLSTAAIRGTVGAALCLNLMAGTVGCSKKTPSPPSSAANVGAALSEADIKQFAAKLEKAAKDNQPGLIAGAIDMNALAEISMQGVPFSDKDKREFLSGMQSGLNGTNAIGQQIAGVVQQGGSFQLLRIVTENGQQKARFRLIQPNFGGFNYMDFLLARRSDGAPRAVDLYIFTSGENLSDTMRRIILPIAQKQGLLARMRQEDVAYVEHIKEYGEIGQAVSAGRHQDALNLYAQLPDSLKKEKSVQILRLSALSNGKEADYLKALDEFQQMFAGDPSADLMAIDYYLMRKEYDQSLNKLERLDKAVGGDPALGLLRASILSEAGRNPEAATLLQKTIPTLPDNASLHLLVLGLCLTIKQYDQVPATLDKLQAMGEPVLDPKDVPDPMFQAFAKSPQYRKWKQSQKR